MKRLLSALILALFSLATVAGGELPFDPVGTWKVAHTDGVPFYITAHADGSAESTWGPGEQGSWAFEGERLHFSWTDGWHDFIYREGDGFAKVAFEPGAPLDGPVTNRTTAERVE